MIKKSLKTLFLIFLTVVPLTGCTKVFDSYEDKLYSEKTVLGDRAVSAKASNVLTRENAIKKALDVFDKGLNIKINRSDFTENIKLVKNDNIGSLEWQIAWYKAYGNKFYTCSLDSSTGKVVGIQCSNDSISKQNTKYKLSISEIKNIIEPLLKQLELDVNDYTIVPMSSHGSNDIYMDNILYTKKNQTKEYVVTIDLVNKTIVRFENLDKQSQQF